MKNFLFGALPASNSESGQLNTLDLKKTGRHLVVVVLGAVLTAALDFLTTWLTGTDFGQYQMLVTFAISSGVLEVIRRWVSSKFVV